MICRNTGAVLRHAMNLLPFFGRRCFVFQVVYVLLYGRGANDAPIGNRDEPREHASGCPAVRPDDKTRFRRNLSQILFPIPLLLSNEASRLQP